MCPAICEEKKNFFCKMHVKIPRIFKIIMTKEKFLLFSIGEILFDFGAVRFCGGVGGTFSKICDCGIVKYSAVFMLFACALGCSGIVRNDGGGDGTFSGNCNCEVVTYSLAFGCSIFNTGAAGTSIMFCLFSSKSNSVTDSNMWFNDGLSVDTSIGLDAISIKVGGGAASFSTVVVAIVLDLFETWLGESTVVGMLLSTLGRFGSDIWWITIGSVGTVRTAESLPCFANSSTVTADRDCIWGPIEGTLTAENVTI